MAAALALHGFAGRRLSPAVGVRGRRTEIPAFAGMTFGWSQGDSSPFYKNTILFPSDWLKDPGPSLARKFLAFFVEKTRFSSKCHNTTSEECIFDCKQKRPAISRLFAGRSER